MASSGGLSLRRGANVQISNQKEILVMSVQDNLQRTVLPIPDQPRSGLILFDAKDPENKYPPINQLRPPQGAPNVLIVLIDDAGFGSATAFGGPCNTPTAEALGAGGLKYNRFHTTA